MLALCKVKLDYIVSVILFEQKKIFLKSIELIQLVNNGRIVNTI